MRLQQVVGIPGNFPLGFLLLVRSTARQGTPTRGPRPLKKCLHVYGIASLLRSSSRVAAAPASPLGLLLLLLLLLRCCALRWLLRLAGYRLPTAFESNQLLSKANNSKLKWRVDGRAPMIKRQQAGIVVYT